MISARRKEYSLCGTMLRVTIFCGVMGSPPSSNRNLELDIQLSLILGTQYPEENRKKKNVRTKERISSGYGPRIRICTNGGSQISTVK